MVFESCDKSIGGENDEDDQEEFVFAFNEEILPSFDVSISVDMPRNFAKAKFLNFQSSMKLQKVMEMQKILRLVIFF